MCRDYSKENVSYLTKLGRSETARNRLGIGEVRMADALAVGDEARVVGLQSRSELNGVVCTLACWDARLSRWKVRLPGLTKLLAIHTSNLQSIAGARPDSARPEIVSARAQGKRARIGFVVERDIAEGKVLVEFETTPGEQVWITESDAAVLPAAPEETVPTEFLYCAVLAREAQQQAGKRRAWLPADVLDVRVDPSGRLRFWVEWRASDGGRWFQASELRPASEADTSSHVETPAARSRKAADESKVSNSEDGKHSTGFASGGASTNVADTADGAEGRRAKRGRGDIEAEAATSSNKWSRNNKQACRMH